VGDPLSSSDTVGMAVGVDADAQAERTNTITMTTVKKVFFILS
jgi:hypothetical protein